MDQPMDYLVHIPHSLLFSARCDPPGVIAHLECIRETASTPSSEEMINKGMKGRSGILESTSSILDLVKEKGMQLHMLLF